MISEIKGLLYIVAIVPIMLIFLVGIQIGKGFGDDFQCPPSTLRLKEISYKVSTTDNGEAEQWLTEFAANVAACSQEATNE